jgi:hypothetical protein
MLTVDVEAQPRRAERDPLERLIWGRFPDGPTGGIDALMSLAERHGARLVTFFDFAEVGIYGDAVLAAAREIDRRGHDVELHAHSEFMPNEYWVQRGVRPVGGTDTIEADQAGVLFDFLCATHAEVCGRPAVAFRGGGYRYNANVLRAMAERGVRLNSSYNAGRSNQLLHRGPLRQFAWDAGCIEVPISCVSSLGSSVPLEFNFNFHAFSRTPSPDSMLDYLDRFYEELGAGAIAVLVMHSWSLSRLQDDGFFCPPLPDYIERFEAFLAAAAQRFEFVTSQDVVELAERGELELGPTLPVDEVDHTFVSPPA